MTSKSICCNAAIMHGYALDYCSKCSKQLNSPFSLFHEVTKTSCDPAPKEHPIALMNQDLRYADMYDINTDDVREAQDYIRELEAERDQLKAIKRAEIEKDNDETNKS